ncbi:CRP/FNR family transcriptional regulator, anaerobic regulatory protein [Tistlia consotensis]|uniref:CRP/FNR family transcriptional regulator, anaerobic regulatory protein n=1 Tax=Tistlia consotensis USBA 355 TaxID=560819 RepID=A0A1Y6B6V4_9PROT|nr:CRP/FNR family transcriptional regulator, anaerobic regulatory protein [Tistlia consotensis USBA 355]SNR28869.1 CRP/FNR family transcriptional regulator, anaerobic regulatory protein [Tistlia consotensis]
MHQTLSPFDISRIRGLAPAQERAGAEKESPCGACSVRHLTFCAPLGEEELNHVTRIVQNVELHPGDPLFDEGEEATNIYSVTAGAMKVYKLLPDGRRQIIGFLFSGDFLGLADDEVYAYSAEAIIHSTLCRFPRRKLEALLERYPRMERRLLGMASHELAAAQEQMLLLGRKTAREKIASFLLLLGQRAAQRGQTANPVSVPMSRNDIGDYLGLTTETVSRTFTQLRQGKLIALLPAGRVDLLDVEALREIAEGN